MKKAAFITGAFSTSFLSFGLISKMMHIPDSIWIILLSGLIFSFIFIPTMFKYLYAVSK